MDDSNPKAISIAHGCESDDEDESLGALIYQCSQTAKGKDDNDNNDAQAQARARAHAAKLAKKRKEPSPSESDQSTEIVTKFVTIWQCDVCSRATFAKYDECVVHEKTCASEAFILCGMNVQPQDENACLAYLRQVHQKLAHQTYMYFLEILKAYIAEKFDTTSLVCQVMNFLNGCEEELIMGFNVFLPKRYRIEEEDLRGIALADTEVDGKGSSSQCQAQSQGGAESETEESLGQNEAQQSPPSLCCPPEGNDVQIILLQGGPAGPSRLAENKTTITIASSASIMDDNNSRKSARSRRPTAKGMSFLLESAAARQRQQLLHAKMNSKQQITSPSRLRHQLLIPAKKINSTQQTGHSTKGKRKRQR